MIIIFTPENSVDWYKTRGVKIDKDTERKIIASVLWRTQQYAAAGVEILYCSS